jgi:hypothetical protein
MEEEDTNGESDVDESNEEGNKEDMPIPASWNQDFASFMNVNDGHDSSWEYHKNNIAKGGMFQDKRHLLGAIIKWEMQTKRLFKTTVSSQKYLTMECIEINCSERVHGYLTWIVSDLVQHTYLIPCIGQNHQNLSSNVIARLLYTKIVEG